MEYALITAARNEERTIGAAIRSVLAQTVLPRRWVIVSDASSDRTDDIVLCWARQHPFLALVRMDGSERRSFASQAHGLNRAMAALGAERLDLIGCMDADITMGPRYFETLLEEFARDPRLGIAGGWIHERGRGGFGPRPLNSVHHVAGAVQMFRERCVRLMGGFTPLPYGGLDTVAELAAEMNGFLVRSYPDLPVYHHRATGAGERPLAGACKAGLMDYELGYRALYEILVCARRAGTGVPVVGSLARLAGFVFASASGHGRRVSAEMLAHVRRQQGRRMRSFAAAVLKGRPGLANL